MVIVPSILSADWSNLRAELDSCTALGITRLHFDVMDGRYVPTLSFGPKLIHDLRPHCTQHIDAHLMVRQPDRYIAPLAAAGVNMITFHVEEENFSFRSIQTIRSHNIEVGIAINPKTPASQLEFLLPLVDAVLVMGVDPGFSGQAFIETTLDKVEQISTMRAALSSSFIISVDGGVSEKNLAALQQRGANFFIMGSAFFSQKDRKAYLDSLALALVRDTS